MKTTEARRREDRIRRMTIALMIWYASQDFSAKADWYVRMLLLAEVHWTSTSQCGSEEKLEAAKRAAIALNHNRDDATEEFGQQWRPFV